MELKNYDLVTLEELENIECFEDVIDVINNGMSGNNLYYWFTVIYNNGEEIELYGMC